MAEIQDRLRAAMHAAVDAEEASPGKLISQVMTRHRRRSVLVASVALLVPLAVAVPTAIAVYGSVSASRTSPSAHHSTPPPSPKSTASAGHSGTFPGLDMPQVSAADSANGTLYIVNAVDNTKSPGYISVVNLSTCNALHASGCTPATYIPVGFIPEGLAVDEATDTIYAVNSASNTVSVINGATCNARHTAGGNRAAAAVHVGPVPVAVDVDQATDTVYVANWGNGTGTTVSVLNGATCNGQVTSGCGQRPGQVSVGAAPSAVLVDQATDTVYVGTVAKTGAESVRVIDGATCNGAATSACGRTLPSVTLGQGAAGRNAAFAENVAIAVDHATATLYVANWASNTVSMIDTARCNAAITSGCAQVPATVRVGRSPSGIAVNPVSQTMYVSNFSDNTLSVLNAATCNANTRSGCSKSSLLRTGLHPADVTVDQATDTVYVANVYDFSMSVLNGATCNASVTFGCH